MAKVLAEAKFEPDMGERLDFSHSWSWILLNPTEYHSLGWKI